MERASKGVAVDNLLLFLCHAVGFCRTSKCFPVDQRDFKMPLRPYSTFIDGFSWAIHQKIADFNSYPLRYQFWKSVYKCWAGTQFDSILSLKICAQNGPQNYWWIHLLMAVLRLHHFNRFLAMGNYKYLNWLNNGPWASSVRFVFNLSNELLVMGVDNITLTAIQPPRNCYSYYRLKVA